MEIQSRIPAALAFLHNFIDSHDQDKLNIIGDGGKGEGEHDLEPDWLPDVAVDDLDARRDMIAHAMWADYLREREARGFGRGDENTQDSDDDE